MADISQILRDWPYDADRVSVRLVRGDDGRDKVQMRLDLGMMQMELDGRPDGQQVFDCPTWLEYYEREQQVQEREYPDGPPYRLGSEECQHLLREGIQFYHRYLSFWHLAMYDRCARDTARNLRLFAFVRRYARHERDRLQFDQWRPYVTMMHARSVAMPLVEAGKPAEAIVVIDEGIAAIEQFLRDYEQLSRGPHVSELSFLRRWRADLVARQDASGDSQEDEAGDASTTTPAERRLRLERELQRAVAAERYEEAARLRDQLTREEFPPGG